ncbi:MAG: STAS domain-containing protein [bacterium]
MAKDSKIIVRTVGDVTVIEVHGNLDIQLSQAMKIKLESLIKFGHQKIVVNLKDTNFIDSTGVGSLMYGLKLIDPTVGDLKLTGLAPHHVNVFNVLELDRVFSIFPTEEGAVSSFLINGATMH